MLLAVVLRVYRLPLESAWCDEVLTLSVLGAPSLSQYLHDAFTVDPMARMVPFYHVLQYGWSRPFGIGDVSLRCLSVTLGVACVPLLFMVTRFLFSARTAILAAFLLALSQVHLHQSQEVRFYALVMALSLLSMMAFLRALDSGSKRWWALHGTANLLLMWTHAFVPLFFLVQGLWLLLLNPRAIRRILVWAAGHAVILLLFVLWLSWLSFRVGQEAHAYHPMLITCRDMANLFVVLAGGRPTRDNPAAYMPGGFSLDLLIAALLMLATITLSIRLVWRRAEWGSGAPILFILLWTYLPILLLYVTSRLWVNVFFYRYIIYSLPAVSALLSAGLLALPGKMLRRCAIAITLGALVYQVAFIPRPVRADYRAAGVMIARGATPGTRVLALKEFNAIAVRYNTPIPEEQIEVYHGIRELKAATIRHLRDGLPTWVVFYWWDDIDAFENHMRDAIDGLHVTRHTFPGMPPLTVCEMGAAE